MSKIGYLLKSSGTRGDRTLAVCTTFKRAGELAQEMYDDTINGRGCEHPLKDECTIEIDEENKYIDVTLKNRDGYEEFVSVDEIALDEWI